MSNEDECAATRIQHCARVFLARRLRSRLRAARSSTFEAKCQSDLEHAAAITLQTAQRRSAARRRVAVKRQETNQLRGANFGNGTPIPLIDGTPQDSVMFFNNSMCSHAGLTTAFALSSVASFAKLQRDHPDVAKAVVGFEMNGPHGLLHECAAIVLQSKWRVHLAREKFKRVRTEKASNFRSACDSELAEVGAITIQRVYRGHRSRQTVRLPVTAVMAAMKLQRAFRSHKARDLRRELSLERKRRFEAEVAASREHEAAVLIQTNVRRHRVQKATTTSTPAAFPRKLRSAVLDVAVTGNGDGRGLSTLFDVAQAQLLDSNVPALCWGIRILHTVAGDIALDPDDPRQSRLPSLEITRWVQGPLGSVLPLTRSVTRR